MSSLDPINAMGRRSLISGAEDVLARPRRLFEVLVDHAKELFGGRRRVTSGPEVPQMRSDIFCKSSRCSGPLSSLRRASWT
jgi:hypothetical protein